MPNLNKTTFIARDVGYWGRGNTPEEAEKQLKSVGGKIDDKKMFGRAMTRVDYDDSIIESFLIDCGGIQVETKNGISGVGSTKYSYLQKVGKAWVNK